MEAEKEKFDAEAFEDFCGDVAQGKLPVFAHILRFLLPICEIVSLVLFLTGTISYGYPLAGFLALLVISWLTKFMTDGIIQPVYYASTVSGEYEVMLSLIRTGISERSPCQDAAARRRGDRSGPGVS